jgi:hypothetical protein
MRRPSAARGPGRGGRLLNQLSSVCQLCVGTYRFARDYGCVHPGMPLGRKHLRRIRGAPTVAARRICAACGWSKNYFHLRCEARGSQLAIGCRRSGKDAPAQIPFAPDQRGFSRVVLLICVDPCESAVLQSLLQSTMKFSHTALAADARCLDGNFPHLARLRNIQSRLLCVTFRGF